MALLVLAVAPSIAIFTLFYLRDRYDKEPWHLLLKVFGLGVFSIVPVALIEGLLFKLWGIDVFNPGSWWVSLLSMVFLVALVEELAKFAVVRGYAWDKEAFNEPYDGIIYTVMASLGFATVENILYVIEWGATVAWLRALLTVPMHALTAVIMGYYIGLAKYAQNESGRGKLYNGLWIAILFHGLFNFFVSSQIGWLIAMAPAMVIYAWVVALRATRIHAKNSPFRKGLKNTSKQNP